MLSNYLAGSRRITAVLLLDEYSATAPLATSTNSVNVGNLSASWISPPDNETTSDDTDYSMIELPAKLALPPSLKKTRTSVDMAYDTLSRVSFALPEG
jgi:hypothetical protein